MDVCGAGARCGKPIVATGRRKGRTPGSTSIPQPYERIDLNVSVDLGRDIVATASLINLTESAQRQHPGSWVRFYSNVYSGRRGHPGPTLSF